VYEVSAYLRQYGTRALKTAGGALQLLGLLSVSAYLSAYETHALTVLNEAVAGACLRLYICICTHTYTHIYIYI
jgi:hypothetical protein